MALPRSMPQSYAARASPAGCFHHRAKNLRAIGAAESRFTSAIGMRHEAEDVAVAIADAGNVFDRAIRICSREYTTRRVGVAQENLAMRI